MDLKKLFCVLLILGLICQTDQSAMAVLTGVTTVVKLIGGGLDIFKSVRNIISGVEQPETIDKQELLADIQGMIDNAKSEILTSFIIISKTEKIEKAFSTVQSLLKDLELLIKSNDQTRPSLQIRFVENYMTNNVEVCIRFLAQLLTFSVPGTSGQLLPTFVEQHRCNMTAFYKFKEFYFNLFSNGVTLDLVYLTLHLPGALNTTIEDWKSESLDLVRTFDNEQEACEAKFHTYASEDLSRANNALRLWNENKERYHPKWNDVMFFPRIGSEQTQLLKYVKENVFYEISSENNKVAIFGHTCDTCNAVDVKKLLEGSKEAIRGVISGKEDDQAAKKVADKIHTLLNDNEFHFSALIVFFDGGGHTPDVYFDEESPVASLFIEDVRLKYCYSNDAECWINDNIWDPFENLKTVYGRFRVYVYPPNTNTSLSDATKDEGTGGGGNTSSSDATKDEGTGGGGWSSSEGGQLHTTSDAAHLSGCYGIVMTMFAMLFKFVI